MNITVAIIIGFVVFGVLNVVVILFLLRRKPEDPLKQDDTALRLLLQQVNELGRTVDSKMHEMTKTMDSKMGETARTVNDSLRTQFGESAKLIRDVTQGLTKLDETNKQV